MSVTIATAKKEFIIGYDYKLKQIASAFDLELPKTNKERDYFWSQVNRVARFEKVEGKMSYELKEIYNNKTGDTVAYKLLVSDCIRKKILLNSVKQDDRWYSLWEIIELLYGVKLGDVCIKENDSVSNYLNALIKYWIRYSVIKDLWQIREKSSTTINRNYMIEDNNKVSRLATVEESIIIDEYIKSSMCDKGCYWHAQSINNKLEKEQGIKYLYQLYHFQFNDKERKRILSNKSYTDMATNKILKERMCDIIKKHMFDNIPDGVSRFDIRKAFTEWKNNFLSYD